jgi:hypothetical protein
MTLNHRIYEEVQAAELMTIVVELKDVSSKILVSMLCGMILSVAWHISFSAME